MMMHRIVISGFGLRAAAACVVLAGSPLAARAGIIAQCAAPVAIRNAEVNVIVLPYFRSTGRVGSEVGAGGQQPDRPLDGLGQQLALLMKLEILYRALSYDHWGVVLLTGSREECEPDLITAKLLKDHWIAPGAKMIVVWGKLYRQDNDVYEQTFARSYRNPTELDRAAPPDVEVKLGGRTFLASIGVDQFAFPPAALSVGFINSVADNFRQAVFLYDAPTLTATKHPLPVDEFRKCDQCPGELAFAVYDRNGDWVHVMTEGKGGNRDGFLFARQSDSNSLSQRMPEISFVQGLMGFLRYVGHTPQMKSALGMQAAEEAFASYAEREEAVQEPEVKAAAWQLRGLLEFARAKIDPTALFDSAYVLVPFSSNARNLAAMFRLYQAYNSPGANIRPREVANDFVAAAALDPKNPVALVNLENFYELLRAPESAARVERDAVMRPEEIEIQLAKVKAIRNGVPRRAVDQ